MKYFMKYSFFNPLFYLNMFNTKKLYFDNKNFLTMKKNDKIEIKNFTKDELSQYLQLMGEPAYRADQIFNWLYNHLSVSFDEMENIPKALRSKLTREAHITSLKKVTEIFSPLTRTKKYLFQTHDNHKIEAVVIPETKRTTLCISTQVGCPLDCKFCATGLMGFTRNLSVGEIVDQYILTAKDYGKKKITNIVFMGMGEPLLNFEATVKAIENFRDELNTGISRNRITVSTAGIPKKIIELADSKLRVKLALSLHSPFDEIRNSLMPINIKHPLIKVIEALKYYAFRTHTRITFEYLMLEGINDRKEDIKKLVKICSQLPSKINLIPFNKIEHMLPTGISASLNPTPREGIEEFASELRAKNITVMIRDTQGDDIAAACGQLAIRQK